MTLRLFPVLITMLLMLGIGVGLGMLIMTSHSSTINAAVKRFRRYQRLLVLALLPGQDRSPSRQTAVRPAPAQYVGVLFARQLADIVADGLTADWRQCTYISAIT